MSNISQSRLGVTELTGAENGIFRENWISIKAAYALAHRFAMLSTVINPSDVIDRAGLTGCGPREDSKYAIFLDDEERQRGYLN